MRQCKKAKQTDSERRRNKKNLREGRAEKRLTTSARGSRIKL
uniref:Uncharacterized protein n=1 Tax=Siphoviridae sp. ctWlk2 TaxID=2825539 RepID=A0A8S5U6N2_9CAUD|nr:MAG TPA: hypothetical protein [Siphoviridae sp. ctWlk2]